MQLEIPKQPLSAWQVKPLIKKYNPVATGCGQMMEDAVVQAALPVAMFNKLQQKRQLEEVEAAGLEDLEKCPACNYATIIPDAGVKVLVCGNPECGKETCRECREESHTPLACNEVERDEEVGDRFRIFMKKVCIWRKCQKWATIQVRARTELENVATEAMIRQCAKCKNRFMPKQC